MINNWEYGNEFDDEIGNWSDDKEVGLSVIDEYFDYVWDFKNGKIHLEDYISASGLTWDETATKREAAGILELWFDTFIDLFKWILTNGYTGKYVDYMKERIA